MLEVKDNQSSSHQLDHAQKAKTAINITLEKFTMKNNLVELVSTPIELAIKMFKHNQPMFQHQSIQLPDQRLVLLNNHLFNSKMKMLTTQVSTSLLNLMELHHLVENNITELFQINLEKNLKRSS